ncbi:DUF1835 domain-containing protein [Paenibacillus chartarius]|uniref:DUF1835 domain-containing protein n=1 Tax=Paenibacillus chartarius TaxID=747481 RepID=A0ABV6DVU5_9BACL
MNPQDMQAITHALDRLGESQLKPYLKFILAAIKRMKEREVPLEESAAELTRLYDQLMRLQSNLTAWDPDPACTHVHIVVGESFAGSMKQALKALGRTETHKLIVLRENYAIGPLGDLDSPEGRKVRYDWFRDNIALENEAYTSLEVEYEKLSLKLERIPEHAEVVLWTCSNASEQAGIRHALHLLRMHGKQNPISLRDACAVSEELYNRPDAYIDYRHSGELPPDKLKEAMVRLDGKGRLGPAELMRLEQEWQDITEQAGTLRIWQNGVVFDVPAHYYDAYLLESLDKVPPSAEDDGFLRATRLIGEAIGHCEQYVGDLFFEYRLRELIYEGILEIKGVPAAMRYYSIRRKRRMDILQ